MVFIRIAANYLIFWNEVFTSKRIFGVHHNAYCLKIAIHESALLGLFYGYKLPKLRF